MILIRWAPAKESALIFLYHEGLRYAEISPLLGVSHEAIKSKCLRLKLKRDPLLVAKPRCGPREGLAPEGRPIQAPVTSLQPIEHNDRCGGGLLFAIKHRLQVKPQADPNWDSRHFPASDTGTAVTLLDAKPWQCRWPSGDPQSPDFRFCGAPICHRSYCQKHAQLAFNPDTGPRVRVPSWVR